MLNRGSSMYKFAKINLFRCSFFREKHQKGFEEVKSGGKQMDDPSKKSLNLQLDNKFTALDTD